MMIVMVQGLHIEGLQAEGLHIEGLQAQGLHIEGLQDPVLAEEHHTVGQQAQMMMMGIHN